MEKEPEIYLDINGTWQKAKTESPEWQRYYADLAKHNSYYDGRKPKRENFASDAEWLTAFNEWSMDEAMSAPNKPGYYRANND